MILQKHVDALKKLAQYDRIFVSPYSFVEENLKILERVVEKHLETREELVWIDAYDGVRFLCSVAPRKMLGSVISSLYANHASICSFDTNTGEAKVLLVKEFHTCDHEKAVAWCEEQTERFIDITFPL